jgi:hypothetical protein
MLMDFFAVVKILLVHPVCSVGSLTIRWKVDAAFGRAQKAFETVVPGFHFVKGMFEPYLPFVIVAVGCLPLREVARIHHSWAF